MKQLGFSVLTVIFLLAGFGYSADVQKIAIGAEGKTASAKVSKVAARAPFFLIFDGSGKLLETVDNPYKDAKGGAGTSVVPFLAQKGATVVVAGEFGKNMIQGMKEKGMKYLEFKGSAEEALKKVQEAKK